jgi:predicted RNase H-like nuclease (RuvC/YqgF family)
MNEETKHLISLLYKGSLSQYGKRKLANIVENQQNRIDELEKALIDEDFKYKNKIDKLKNKLKEHKKDLDYEPWSIYKIDGKVLFDLVKIMGE